MALTDYEEDLFEQCRTRGGHCSVTPYEGENVMLFWADSWAPEWDPDSGVRDVAGVAWWLERAYQQMREWMGME